jgi:hypothetical protein
VGGRRVGCEVYTVRDMANNTSEGDVAMERAPQKIAQEFSTGGTYRGLVSGHTLFYQNYGKFVIIVFIFI